MRPSKLPPITSSCPKAACCDWELSRTSIKTTVINVSFLNTGYNFDCGVIRKLKL